ncbi:hypothetical protein V3C99_012706 [Haemonchus contortus]
MHHRNPSTSCLLSECTSDLAPAHSAGFMEFLRQRFRSLANKACICLEESLKLKEEEVKEHTESRNMYMGRG